MTHTVESISEALEKVYDKLGEAESAYREERVRLLDMAGKLEAWLWKNAELTADTVVHEYVALRDKRSELKKVYDNEDDELKDKMALRENWLLRALQAIGGDGIRTSHGTAFIQTKTRSNCSDWPMFWDYIATNNRFDLLEKRVSQAPISKMVEDGTILPPGINLHQEQVVQVRRS